MIAYIIGTCENDACLHAILHVAAVAYSLITCSELYIHALYNATISHAAKMTQVF